MANTVRKVFDVALDIAASIGNRAFTVVEGDTGNLLRISLTDGGEAVDLTGCRVIAAFSKSSGTAAQDSGLEDGGILLRGALNNEVHIQLFPASFAAGMVECELQIYSDASLSTLVTTAKFNFNCRPAMLSEEALSSAAEMPMLKALMNQVEALRQEAQAAADQARAAAAAAEELVLDKVTTFVVHRYGQEQTEEDT